MLLWLTPVGFGVTVLQEEIMGALEGVPLVFHCPAVHEVDAAECQALTVCPGAVCVHAVVLAAAAAMRVPCVRCGGSCAALSLNVVVCAVGRSKAPPTCLKLAPPWVSSGWC